jgi:DNA-binding NarL/FixJ family response regulator
MLVFVQWLRPKLLAQHHQASTASLARRLRARRHSPNYAIVLVASDGRCQSATTSHDDGLVAEILQALLATGSATAGLANGAYPPEVDSPNANDRAVDRLTGREAQVLQRIVAGQTNRAIATGMVLSPRTVAHHVSSILNKLGVASRTEAAAMAVRCGVA